MGLFAFATLTPAVLIACAALWGGVWALAALGFVTALVAGLDEMIRRIRPPLSEAEFPAATGLSATLGVVHLALLPIVILALSGNTLGSGAKAALFVATGLYLGQVGNANAHELIHKTTRGLHRLGVWVYIALLFGHHASAHVLVHHRLAATRDDPNTARYGESYYRFMQRAWIGSFRAGYAAERNRLARLGRSMIHHPYVLYGAGSLLMLSGAGLLGGPAGVLWYMALALFAQQQLLLCDYVQHYGLTRRTDAQGKREAFGPAHSWDSPHWFSSAFMLNAPRHADHHAHPGRNYAGLTLDHDSPTLPRSLPVMACVALVPKAWRQVMDPRVAAWQKAA